VATWHEFEKQASDLGAFGRERLNDRVAYLATTRRDGSPRVHPVSARIREGRLFVRMSPSSPKARDLLRDGRFAMHSLVTDTSGTGGEFAIAGNATQVNDRASIDLVNRGLPGSPDRYIIFELAVREAGSTVYDGGSEIRHKWSEARSG